MGFGGIEGSPRPKKKLGGGFPESTCVTDCMHLPSVWGRLVGRSRVVGVCRVGRGSDQAGHARVTGGRTICTDYFLLRFAHLYCAPAPRLSLPILSFPPRPLQFFLTFVNAILRPFPVRILLTWRSCAPCDPYTPTDTGDAWASTMTPGTGTTGGITRRT